MIRLLLVLLLLASTAEAQQPIRLAAAFGAVTLRDAGSEAFNPARSGSLLGEGMAVRTGAGARAVLALPAGFAALDPGGHLDLPRGDGVTLILTRGALALELRDAPAFPLQVATPRGVVEMLAAGRYLIEVSDPARPTGLQVVIGSARLVTQDGAIQVEAGQRAWVPVSGPAQRAPAGSVPPLLGWLAGEPPPPLPVVVAPTPPPIVQPAPQGAPEQVGQSSVVVIQEPYSVYVPTWPILPPIVRQPIVRQPIVRPPIARPPIMRPPIMQPPLRPSLHQHRQDGSQRSFSMPPTVRTPSFGITGSNWTRPPTR